MSNPAQTTDRVAGPSVAFLGLGRMGSVMASRLLDAGTALSVWNRTSAKCDPLVSRGADRLARLPDAATREVVFSMVLDDGALAALHDPRTASSPGAVGTAQRHRVDRRFDGVAASGHRGGRGCSSRRHCLRVGPGQREPRRGGVGERDLRGLG